MSSPAAVMSAVPPYYANINYTSVNVSEFDYRLVKFPSVNMNTKFPFISMAYSWNFFVKKLAKISILLYCWTFAQSLIKPLSKINKQQTPSFDYILS